LTPSWASANSWKVNYKSKSVCDIRLTSTQFYSVEDNAWYVVNREYRNICACTCINLCNPDESLCDFAKKLIILKRDAIFTGRVPKCMLNANDGMILYFFQGISENTKVITVYGANLIQ